LKIRSIAVKNSKGGIKPSPLPFWLTTRKAGNSWFVTSRGRVVAYYKITSHIYIYIYIYIYNFVYIWIYNIYQYYLKIILCYCTNSVSLVQLQNVTAGGYTVFPLINVIAKPAAVWNTFLFCYCYELSKTNSINYITWSYIWFLTFVLTIDFMQCTQVVNQCWQVVKNVRCCTRKNCFIF